jgi:hypothetical protein
MKDFPRLDPIAGEDGIPPSGFQFDRAGLGMPFQWTMKLDPDFADTRQPKTLRSNKRKTRILGPCHAVIPITALESGISGLFSSFDSTEELLKRQLQSDEHVLQDLGMYLGKFRADLLDLRKLILLIRIIDANRLFPGFTTLFKRCVIELTAEPEPCLEDGFLMTVRIKTILECTPHQFDSLLLNA